jgi:hypothetical protein
MDQQHEMILDTTHSSGAEEWYCPTCGRRMSITWHPWKKIVLDQGDMYVEHSASKGGLRIERLTIAQGNNGDPVSAMDSITVDPYLAPWIRWLENIDLDDLGNV